MENQEQTNTPQKQGIDFNSMDKKTKAVLIGAAAGVIGCFLPLVSFMGFSVSLLGAGGLGYLVFFGLIFVIVSMLFGDKMNMTAEQSAKMNKYGVIGIAALWLINILQLDGFSFSIMGIGFYIVTFALAFLVLIFTDVIKYDK